jgi:hypothetical protein
MYATSPQVIAALLFTGLFAGVVLSLPDDALSLGTRTVAVQPAENASGSPEYCEKQAWPYLDQRCADAKKDAAAPTRQVRVISTDRGAAPVIVTAIAPVVEQTARAEPRPAAPQNPALTAAPQADTSAVTHADLAAMSTALPAFGGAALAAENVTYAPPPAPEAAPPTPEPKQSGKAQKAADQEAKRMARPARRDPAKPGAVPPAVIAAAKAAAARAQAREGVPAEVLAAIEADVRRARPIRNSTDERDVVAVRSDREMQRIVVVPRENLAIIPVD